LKSGTVCAAHMRGILRSATLWIFVTQNRGFKSWGGGGVDNKKQIVQWAQTVYKHKNGSKVQYTH
jgi:hypothetical protein